MHPALAKEYFLRHAELLPESPVLLARGIQVVEIGDMYIDLIFKHPQQGVYCRMRLDCKNYDFEPPLGNMMLPDGSGLLPFGFWPSSAIEHHMYTKGFCTAKTRGYHDHQSHLEPRDNPYYQLRNSITLDSVIVDLYNKVVSGTFPQGGPYDGWEPKPG